MSHYFIKDENLKSDRKNLDYFIGGNKLIFTTDSGIFSKDSIDYASDLFVQNVPNLNGKTLDLGCGYGFIGIALSKLYDIDLIQSDVNPLATELSEINCKQNDVKSKIILSDCFENIDEKFDNILLNPPIHAGKSITYKMYEEAKNHLNEGGRFFVVTLKKHGAQSTYKKLLEVFENCEEIYKKKGYHIFSCKF